ncbi:hypothetical protein [Streptomyces sp. NPDC007083]|uniref:hypothetical protein n=1 Tax=unclassified Streptomyces TaxID=2593676 RepID=UPI0033F5C9E9
MTPVTVRPRRAAARFAALTLAALTLLSLPSAATVAAVGAATPPGLSCHTGRHHNDEYTGYALCRNNGRATQAFWVHLVCGWSPDIDGEHVTLRPGQSGQSTAHCSKLGSGIGRIEVRP